MAESAAVASKQYALYDVKGEQKSSVINCQRLRTYWLPKTGINTVRSTAYIVALIVALTVSQKPLRSFLNYRNVFLYTAPTVGWPKGPSFRYSDATEMRVGGPRRRTKRAANAHQSGIECSQVVQSLFLGVQTLRSADAFAKSDRRRRISWSGSHLCVFLRQNAQSPLPLPLLRA